MEQEGMKKTSKSIKISTVYLLCLLFLLAGSYIGSASRSNFKLESIWGNKQPTSVSSKNLSSFWEIWNLIDEKYPESEKISSEDRLFGATNGLVESLDDPYSIFLKPKESKEFKEDVNGEFTGIGVEIGTKEKILTVIAPLKGTPAEKAGLRAGDKILKIEENLTTDMTIEKAINLIRGEKGTYVTLTIVREKEDEPREIKVMRDVINVPSVETKILPDGIFVISIYTFGNNTAKNFALALEDFHTKKFSKMIIDLRGNPGGFLETSIDLASWFLPEGKVVVMEDFGGKQEAQVYRSRGYELLKEPPKLIILVDGGSASASEILAGALHEQGVAKLVGEKTYGKGSVQELIDLDDGSAIKLTVAKWLTPNGISISEEGLTPDYEVPVSKEDLEKEKDPQMDKAAELLVASD